MVKKHIKVWFIPWKTATFASKISRYVHNKRFEIFIIGQKWPFSVFAKLITKKNKSSFFACLFQNLIFPDRRWKSEIQIRNLKLPCFFKVCLFCRVNSINFFRLFFHGFRDFGSQRARWINYRCRLFTRQGLRGRDCLNFDRFFYFDLFDQRWTGTFSRIRN